MQSNDNVELLLGVLQVEGLHKELEDKDPNGVVVETVEDLQVRERLQGAELQHSLAYLEVHRRLVLYFLFVVSILSSTYFSPSLSL